MMDSCSHIECQQSFYLPLHSEGMPCSSLFHRPPYLILLLPPPLLLLLVHRLLPENLATERRRRVKGKIQWKAGVTKPIKQTKKRGGGGAKYCSTFGGNYGQLWSYFQKGWVIRGSDLRNLERAWFTDRAEPLKIRFLYGVPTWACKIEAPVAFFWKSCPKSSAMNFNGCMLWWCLFILCIGLLSHCKF